ncbi:hypothetical protein phiK7A1_139 [Pseudomonas phage phiK7A1]|uniref:Uncharacterized protein n=1 Tax=Pseudomonas phage phiK7A1 TaxID=2759194 RepID=A0A7H0XFY7_9CAUD|nr:hypothetical protein phiK7A1_139 [Pseudomonas phage phiK7A1]
MSLTRRCRAGKSNESYAGVENRFEGFQEFAEWCNSQPDYGRLDEKGNRWQLDKDLFGGYYSPETCVFIPAALNTLLKAAPKKQGDLPVGVTVDNSNDRKQMYSVRYFMYKRGYVGRARFNCPVVAGKHWRRNRGESLMEAYSDQELSIRVCCALAKLAINIE